MGNRAKPFFQGKTRQTLKAEIRAFLAGHDLGDEFEFSLLSELINAKHYYCEPHNLRPTRFKKTFRIGGYEFWGSFPDHGWHRVSWAQCISPRRDEDWIKRALRDAARPFIVDYKGKHPTCERCGCNETQDVDHVSPEFDDIAHKIIADLSDADWLKIIMAFDWWKEDAFAIPPGSPALQELQLAHRTAILQAVCKSCHLANANDRKRQ